MADPDQPDKPSPARPDQPTLTFQPAPPLTPPDQTDVPRPNEPHLTVRQSRPVRSNPTGRSNPYQTDDPGPAVPTRPYPRHANRHSRLGRARPNLTKETTPASPFRFVPIQADEPCRPRPIRVTVLAALAQHTSVRSTPTTRTEPSRTDTPDRTTPDLTSPVHAEVTTQFHPCPLPHDRSSRASPDRTEVTTHFHPALPGPVRQHGPSQAEPHRQAVS